MMRDGRRPEQEVRQPTEKWRWEKESREGICREKSLEKCNGGRVDCKAYLRFHLLLSFRRRLSK